MKIRWMLAIATLAVVAAFTASEVQAQPLPYNYRRATSYPWHGGFAHTQWGQPVALVVPPTAHLQTKWSWGVANTEIARIPHQFGRAWPGPYAGGYGFLSTPNWPSHTDQFGVYYVRGPW